MYKLQIEGCHVSSQLIGSIAGNSNEVSTSSGTEEEVASFVDSGVGTATSTTFTSGSSCHEEPLACTSLMTRPHSSKRVNICECRSCLERHTHTRHKTTHRSAQSKHSLHCLPTIPELPQNGIFIVYTYIPDWSQYDIGTPFAHRVGESEVTLKQFKEKVFSRKGHYRYFFKSYYEELDMEVMEEYTDRCDSTLLPVVLFGRDKRKVIIGSVTCT